MIRQNLGYKLFALLAAFGLWAYVNSERSPLTTVSLSVPLEAHNVVKGTVVKDLPDRVSVIVTGPKQVVETLTRDQISAYVSVANTEPGEHRELPVHVALAPEIRMEVSVRPSPARVKVTTEETISRAFPIEVNFVSPQPIGYAWGEPEVLPSLALVTGRRSAVASIKRLVVNVDVGGASSTLDSFFPVVASDGSRRRVAGVTIDPRTVRVRMQFQETPSERSVLVSPTIVGLPNPPARVHDVEVIPPSVTLLGDANRLVAIGTVTTDPINISGATGNVSRTVRIRVPAGVSLAGSQRVQVNIRIE